MKTLSDKMTKLFISIVSTLLLITILPFQGNSQNVNFKFNHLASLAAISADSMVVTNVDLVVNGGNKYLKLRSNSVILLKNVVDCAQIRFDFSSINATGNTTIGFSYTKSNVVMNSVFFDQPQNTSVNSTEFSSQVITQELPGTNDIKIQMVSSDVIEVYIDNISILKLTNSRRQALEEAAFFTRFQNINSEAEYRDYYTKTSTFTQGNFETIHSLYFKYNTLATFADITLFIDSRTKLLNPTSFDSFNKNLDSLKKYADDRGRTLIENLEAKMRKLTDKPPVNSKLGNILSIGSNVLNIVTGGQFSSIFNSIKTLTATIFNEDVLKAKFSTTTLSPANVKYIEDLPRKGIQSTSIILNEQKFNAANARGESLQKQMNFFLDTLENEQRIYSQIISDFNGFSVDVKVVRDSLLLLAQEYYQIFNIPFDQRTFTDLTKMGNMSTTPTFVSYKGIITNYLAPLASRTGTHRVSLDKLNSKNQKVNTLAIEYSTYSQDLYSMFLEFALDYNRPNPYVSDPVVATEYAVMRTASLEKYCLLLNSLDRVLIRPIDFKQYKASLDRIRTDNPANGLLLN